MSSKEVYSVNPGKNPNGGLGHGISRGIEKRVSKWKFHGSIKKEIKFPSRASQEKIIWNFHGSWFLAFQLPRGFA